MTGVKMVMCWYVRCRVLTRLRWSKYWTLLIKMAVDGEILLLRNVIASCIELPTLWDRCVVI